MERVRPAARPRGGVPASSRGAPCSHDASAARIDRQPSPRAGGTQPSPAGTSVHGLVVSHGGEGDAVSAVLAPLAFLVPDQQRAGALAVHQALPAVLLVAFQQPAA